MRFSFDGAPGGAKGLCAGTALTLMLAGGCVFAPAGKRGNVEDELATETELTLRTLDGADSGGALPALVSLADNAGRMDEVGLRIQTIMLIAKTLDAEAGLWTGEKAESIRAAARRQAGNALREAEDWRRFEPGNEEAVFLEHDARILRARMEPGNEAELEMHLRGAVQAAVAKKDWSRAAAWQLALSQIQAKKGFLGEARMWFGAGESSFAKMIRGKKIENDPASETLRFAFAEAKADMAFYGGNYVQAAKLYEEALELARKMRRRGEIKRILVKQADTAEHSGDADRAAWYRKRAKGVTKKSSASAGDRLLGKAEPPPSKRAPAKQPGEEGGKNAADALP